LLSSKDELPKAQAIYSSNQKTKKSNLTFKDHSRFLSKALLALLQALHPKLLKVILLQVLRTQEIITLGLYYKSNFPLSPLRR